MSDIPRAHLAVVIVSFNTAEQLRGCLLSLRAALVRTHAWLTSDIIVVDNASSDGSAGMVAREFPEVHLAALPENLGFTGGNNHALELLGLLGSRPILPKPDFVFLLNPDTLVIEDAAAVMVRFLQETPQAGICGGGLRYPEGRFQHGAFAFPGVVQVALDLLPLPGSRLGSRLRASRANGRYSDQLWESGRPFPVDFVLGAAMMVRSEVITQIGGLDDAYFMYCEEMDYCLRAAEAGWGVFAVPAARIVHLEAQSSRQVRWPAFERLWKSRLRFYTQHRLHFAPGTLATVRLIVRVTMWIEAWRALGRFAGGRSTGTAAGAEIGARHAIMRCWSHRP